MSNSTEYSDQIAMLSNIDKRSTYARILANKKGGHALRGSRNTALLEHYISDVATLLGCPRESIVLAGGAVVSILSSEEPRDIDFSYVGDLDDLLAGCPATTSLSTHTNYIGMTLPSSGLEAQLLRHRPAVSLNEATMHFNNFDFLHCCIGYCTLGGIVHPFVGSAVDALYDHIFSKKLKVHNPVDGGRTLLRAFKFTQRGWSINPKEQRKLILQLTMADIVSVQRLEDSFTKPDEDHEGGSQ